MTTKVYAAISEVTKALAKEGIQKNQKNQHQGFNFRGIDQVYGALAAKLPAAGLVIIPRVVSKDVTEKVNNRGNAMFYVTLEVEYDLVSTEDGSTHTARVLGESMDSGDKATSKAMSAAFKYLCFQLFSIPIEGQEDADAETHEVYVPITDLLQRAKTARAVLDLWNGLSKEDQDTYKDDFSARKAELKQAAEAA